MENFKKDYLEKLATKLVQLGFEFDYDEQDGVIRFTSYKGEGYGYAEVVYQDESYHYAINTESQDLSKTFDTQYRNVSDIHSAVSDVLDNGETYQVIIDDVIWEREAILKALYQHIDNTLDIDCYFDELPTDDDYVSELIDDIKYKDFFLKDENPDKPTSYPRWCYLVLGEN